MVLLYSLSSYEGFETEGNISRHKEDLSNCRIIRCVLWMTGGYRSEASPYMLSLRLNLRNSRFWNHNRTSR
ncbi:hypothetical protein IGI04_032756 [Brassica rapa subsp. trilocularis]|uniref:Uncharacterized protein n=1 Tax=Brassica rapa subsp. trilocularis TaxID=1813537 RepID=A0ABQ7LXB8_BRACM|nr:hypothetical protein IGI04_032756 [Brassica rapa subsp. trilocularis]